MFRTQVRAWIHRHTAFTTRTIPDGKRGEFSKITEEYLELEDAIDQKNRKLTFIEACDLVDVSLAYQWQTFRCPTLIVLALVYFRRLYKPVRDRFYRFYGFKKEYWNSLEHRNENT